MHSLKTAEAAHVLAQQQVPSGAIGTSILAVIALGALVWYCKKHKGYDWPQMVLGGAFVVVLAATPWGGGLINGISGAIFSIFTGVGQVLS
ncbi:hypothetical protein [Nonomuraea sp. NPDC023979]|uniref:hypothetical protein n=1 Tax=Nonomuraea sp. NPDC023979 TaxID=3154796 RepID=UPI0033D98D0C